MDEIKRAASTIVFVIGVIASSGVQSYANDQCGNEMRCCAPFGGYCKGSEWGWYGARKIVSTSKEAVNIIKTFFSAHDIDVVNVREKTTFFEAEVRDRKNALMDVVIIDKRTGRIRSIY